ncbi:hypothetical protein BC826DRAFT_912402 [Russula brevipes]|nr:hypothetical protein BC826DRAFT_912418 [Russula brevipes]KAI0291485.1 hypothetical protein BC826DRAFT_912402 [Russula brevipes]
MTKANMVNGLGTISKSGTKALSSGADISIIGQFGVGFFSLPLVLFLTRQGRLCFTTKCKARRTARGLSTAASGGTFAITLDTVSPPLGCGTEVRLYLKEDQAEYLV